MSRTLKFAIWALALLAFPCFTAELWSNEKPLLLHFDGQLHAPAFSSLRGRDFGRSDELELNYAAVAKSPGGWALWAPNRWGPFEANKVAATYPAPPSSTNWLGTDDRGRDVLARLLYGGRLGLIFTITVSLISSLIAALTGVFSGYAGKWTDIIFQRGLELLMTVPQFFLLLIIISFLRPSLNLLILFNAAFGWMWLSQYVRAEALRVRASTYVEAARASGAGHARILFRHVLPNSMAPVLTFLPLQLAGGLTSLTALDFMGIGLPPPLPSWGELLQQGEQRLGTAWWLVVFPTLAVFVFLMSVTLINIELREGQGRSISRYIGKIRGRLVGRLQILFWGPFVDPEKSVDSNSSTLSMRAPATTSSPR